MVQSRSGWCSVGQGGAGRSGWCSVGQDGAVSVRVMQCRSGWCSVGQDGAVMPWTLPAGINCGRP